MTSSNEEAISEALFLMTRFAERTGLTRRAPQRRYLWTDAFAVCNFLALAKVTGVERYGDLALDAVDQVHHVLGRHRADDRRCGWISGLGEREGERFPTSGGLRIGKELPERPCDVPFDERLEWERDGQYFHYLTKWMHALDQVAWWTGEPRFNTWARELADVAHRSFTTGAPGRRRMVWKMSIDLSRPLVASMGHHDPLDGLLTVRQLQATARALSGSVGDPELKHAAAEFETLIQELDWVTPDPLGLGGLLVDACRASSGDLRVTLLAASRKGLALFERQGGLDAPASRRLAFRELGLALGIHAVQALDEEWPAAYRPLGSAVVSFWSDPEHRTNPAWTEHRDINEVMLATCLVPEGMLKRPPLR